MATRVSSAARPRRPAISVVVPFTGDAADGVATFEGLSRLSLMDGDEVIVADNSAFQALASLDPGDITVVRAERERSSYYTRNRGAEAATNEWLLFIDADCRPEPALLDLLFEPMPADRTGVVAGGVVGDERQTELLARWARSRRHLSEEHHTVVDSRVPYPAGPTNNLLVRTEAWEALGGFHEGIRSGGDIELNWRLQDAGWGFEHRPRARVHHVHVTGVRTLARQASRHQGGRLWVRRRYPGAFPRPRLVRPLARCAAGALVWGVTGRFERAVFKLVDAISITGGGYGWYLGSNEARPNAPRPVVEGATEPSLVVITDAFPARSETFVYNEVRRLVARGRKVLVESSVRPAWVERSVARELEISYLEDDPPRRKAADLAWIWSRHPIRCLRDHYDRRRWAQNEETWGLAAIAPAARRLSRTGGDVHIHAHFASRAALHGMRLSRLAGVPYSLTAHAYDIFQEPRNLAEKLARASFAAGECDYTVSHMRSLVGDSQAERIHRIATGVDCEQFQRTTPYGRGGRVVAVGRLVEKKGFSDLIRAAAHLRDHPRLESITIAGEGPLRDELKELIADLGLGDVVTLVGNVWGAGGVRTFLEDADVLVIPAVLARDGDRDALPVISYEALAMEVPVIASDLVGLPEVVKPPWGRLVPPEDAEALAAEIAELLETPIETRAEMGREGRSFVREHGNPELETDKLELLFETVSRNGRPRSARGAPVSA